MTFQKVSSDKWVSGKWEIIKTNHWQTPYDVKHEGKRLNCCKSLNQAKHYAKYGEI